MLRVTRAGSDNRHDGSSSASHCLSDSHIHDLSTHSPPYAIPCMTSLAARFMLAALTADEVYVKWPPLGSTCWPIASGLNWRCATARTTSHRQYPPVKTFTLRQTRSE